jgi:hypothetical protein
MLFVVIAIAGVMAVFSAQREAFPRLEYNYTSISTIYPGANAVDAERHLSFPRGPAARGCRDRGYLFLFPGDPFCGNNEA